jgi:tricorn protease
MRVAPALALGLSLIPGGAGPAVAASPSSPRLLQTPTLSETAIAFAYAGDLWTVNRSGGTASRLVSCSGGCSDPHFSPDGTRIAFSMSRDRNTDVYVVAFAGGEPLRVTYHPGREIVRGWTPDGERVLFSSDRETMRDLDQLYTIAARGGIAEKLPLPSGEEASYSADGKRLAYVPFNQWQPAWKHYRGGQTARIWIADLADSRITRVPRENSNDRDPVWAGNTVYFLSDRKGPVSVFAYDGDRREVREVVANPRGLDINSLASGPGGLVYSQFGSIHLIDTASGAAREVPITIAADLPETRPHMEKVSPRQILHAALSPSGKRVLFEARGEILSVPAEKGDVRNLTMSPGVADRFPSWSPDGKWVAWFSDASGEYALHLGSPDGLSPVRVIGLGKPPSFFYAPQWSPDGREIAYTDKRLNLWMLDVEKPAPVKIDTDRYDTPNVHLDPSWSPDSAWIAYTKQEANHLHAAYVYSLKDHRSFRLTDMRSDVASPRFDKSGKYLYFISRTGKGLGAAWLDMSSLGRATASSVYVLVLRSDLPSPLPPESDEEAPESATAATAAKSSDGKSEGKPPKDKASAPEPVRIDFAGLDQRILTMPIPRANFTTLSAGGEGILFTAAAPTALTDEDYLESEGDAPPPEDLGRFDLKTRKFEPLVHGADGATLAVSADGGRLLYGQKGKWFVVASDKAPKEAEGALKLENLSVWSEPRAEWKQIYHEAWRIERDFLYDPGAHGVDLAAAEKAYAPYLERIGSRGDLNVLLEEMTGHISLGHTFVRSASPPEQGDEAIGLLGADIGVADGHYRFVRILKGENWNPKDPAPLTQPGVNVVAGDYLLAVNGTHAAVDGEVFRYFIGLAGKQTVLTVSAKPDGSAARHVTVVPVASERTLRLRSWMEGNRELVDRLSGGRLAYVYIPDTGAGGFANFNRYYYSQVDKQGAILDERFNHGGFIADFIIDNLRRTPQMINTTREGEDMIEPASGLFGPKVMIINQSSGSGGDALPWLFRKQHVGTLVGTRTWGGLVGIGLYPPLIDGGEITAPRWALYGTSGEWEVENHGIPPDVEVEEGPALTRQGHDPQLEKAVEIALSELERTPPPEFTHPPYPRYPIVLPGVE